MSETPTGRARGQPEDSLPTHARERSDASAAAHRLGVLRQWALHRGRLAPVRGANGQGLALAEQLQRVLALRPEPRELPSHASSFS